MSAQLPSHAASYVADDPETALKERTCTLYAAPGPLGYTKLDGPHPFGTPIALPEPFGLELDTSDF